MQEAIRRRCRLLALGMMVLGVGSCSGDSSTAPKPTPTPTGPVPSGIVLSTTTLSLRVGEQRTVTAVVRDASGNTLTTAVAWSSSQSAVAVVTGGRVDALTAGGVVSAVSPGTATISAIAGGAVSTVIVTVTSGSGGGGGGGTPAAITISPADPQTVVGGTVQLSAMVRDNSGAVLNIAPTWSSADPTIATVSASGLVTGVQRFSRVAIVARAGNVSASASVWVAGGSGIPVRMEIAPSRGDLAVGKTMQFSAIARDNADIVLGVPITWSSNDPSIVTVTQTGVVTGVRNGTTSIVARAGDVSIAAPISVTASASTILLVTDNRLLGRVALSVAGQSIGTVPREETREGSVPSANPLIVDWEVVEPVLNGRVIGDRMSGRFTIANPGSTARIEINNVVGTSHFFAPLVTNRTSVPMLMMVNGGLTSENRCDCVVPAFSTNAFLGYYRLASNSNVRAFRSGTNYTGAYWEFYSFSNRVEGRSGVVTFTVDTPP